MMRLGFSILALASRGILLSFVESLSFYFWSSFTWFATIELEVFLETVSPHSISIETDFLCSDLRFFVLFALADTR